MLHQGTPCEAEGGRGNAEVRRDVERSAREALRSHSPSTPKRYVLKVRQFCETQRRKEDVATGGRLLLDAKARRPIDDNALMPPGEETPSLLQFHRERRARKETQ